MSKPAYYNEIDPFAAETLRNLIHAGLIAPGVVDERSIEDVRPDDLRGFAQCHFFAGIGVWSYALRRAGWPDDRPIWTGSCPCQPFSAAGKGNGFADERHLWPAFFHLITQHRPAAIAGEQVASRDADPWIDLVQSDLEALGYAFGAIPFPSAGVGAPHIRDRLYWVADTSGEQRHGRAGVAGDGRDATRIESERLRNAGGLAHANGGNASAEREQRGREQRQQPQDGGRGGLALIGLDHADDARLEGLGRGHQAEGGRVGTLRPTAAPGESSGLGLAHDGGLKRSGLSAQCGIEGDQRDGEACGVDRGHDGGSGDGIATHSPAGPTNGFWRDADWLGCRDGKWRPVEPGTFPLAHGAAARVGRLRAYGNAINADAARVFIQAMMGVM